MHWSRVFVVAVGVLLAVSGKAADGPLADPPTRQEVCLREGPGGVCLQREGDAVREVEDAPPVPESSDETPEYEPAPARTCCKVCTKGCPCGDSCISCSKTCRKGPGCAC
ncbi:hypothetical protein MYSTI_05772 [Myxococcus stipitatus DSM 14675]|uniref:Metallothionein n=1 Tax=Myxococcus stipitatus (strain DSM 14675 / JCM 12634 / Mx s8) TaxID=1278073 RepID=L7UG94_MYXSD|nr:hypothetical protein [Myxococcus stipitatus]AGC47048.1 hypothetical protein MYSTI_05772 [Myxococcus stipitatus DSM 14675]